MQVGRDECFSFDLDAAKVRKIFGNTKYYRTFFIDCQRNNRTLILGDLALDVMAETGGKEHLIQVLHPA